MAFLLVGADARGVLFDEFSENKLLEDGEHHCRQQIVDKRAVDGIRRKPDAKNVEADVKPVPSDRGRMAFKVGSGRYTFVAR